MDLQTLRDLFVDDTQDVRIYDLSGDVPNIIYEGAFGDMPEELDYQEIMSIDILDRINDGFLGINIDMQIDE